jgi:hypothetical protein
MGQPFAVVAEGGYMSGDLSKTELWWAWLTCWRIEKALVVLSHCARRR